MEVSREESWAWFTVDSGVEVVPGGSRRVRAGRSQVVCRGWRRVVPDMVEVVVSFSAPRSPVVVRVLGRRVFPNGVVSAWSTHVSWTLLVDTEGRCQWDRAIPEWVDALVRSVPDADEVMGDLVPVAEVLREGADLWE